MNGHRLSVATVEYWLKTLSKLTVEQIKSYPQIVPDRADILLGGILILREFLRDQEASEITVSDRGLRYGILVRFLEGQR